MMKNLPIAQSTGCDKQQENLTAKVVKTVTGNGSGHGLGQQRQLPLRQEAM